MLSGIDAEAREHLCKLCLGDHFINLIQSLYALPRLVFRDKLPLVAATFYFRRLVPIASPTTPHIAGLHTEAIWTSDDFDEPLPEEFCIGEA
jgi:hypothetical protein